MRRGRCRGLCRGWHSRGCASGRAPRRLRRGLHALRGQRELSRIRWISRVLINQGPRCLVIGVWALPVA